MPEPDDKNALPRSTAGWSLAIGIIAVSGIILGITSDHTGFAAVRSGVLRAIWILPGLVCLHLAQLLLAAVAWRGLFSGSAPGILSFYRLRIIREGIDSLLPVAQIGGEIVGARLLSREGIGLSQAAASVIVDVTIELLTQVMFLIMGLCVLSWLSQGAARDQWIEAVLAGGAATAAFVLAQRFGLLRALEALLRGMAARWPAMAGASLDGLHAAALDFYRRPVVLLQCGWPHLLAWMLGSIETWAILNALGTPATALQAFTIESLGMAARSAGFAIPAALGAQEGGFVLAAAAVGLPVAPALALSLVKRMREVLVGLIGMALWRLTIQRTASS